MTVKQETIEDALLATEILRNDPRIDSARIFIIGHSMGGMLAPRIDAEGGNYRGIILMAGTARKLEEVMMEQMEEAFSNATGLMKKIGQKQIDKFANLFGSLSYLSDEEAKKQKLGNGVTLYYFKEMSHHATTDYLMALQKPVLVMQGEKDFQVLADKDFRAYQNLLKANRNATFKLYENLNHAFVPSVYGSIAKVKQEYAVEQHIGQEVIADIGRWINRMYELG